VRSYLAVIANAQPVATTDGVSATWLLVDQNGVPLFDAEDVVVKAVYLNGTLQSPSTYTNNNGSTNGAAPSGSITFATVPAAGRALTWSGTAQSYALNIVPVELAQYANSPIMVQLLKFMNQWIDPSVDIQGFYNTIWNIQTAVGIGLDIWGRIVGIPRTINLSDTSNYFGFEGGGSTITPFNDAPFYSGPVQGTLFTLADDAYRVLILTKALANISSFTAPSINKLLAFMFAGRGSCYVTELSAMQIQYTFNFALQPWEESVLLQPALMPRPAGVGVTIVVV
jgi:hypothetical protein